MKAFAKFSCAASLMVGVALATAPAFADDAAPMAMVAPSANPAGADPIPGDATYKAFHGQEGIDRLIDDFVSRITADPRISERFANANLVRLRFELKQQVCYLTGGPCTYTGKDMKTAHAGMGLQNLDFNALAEDLQISMTKENIGFPAQNRLLAKLAPMQRPIVTK
jgi:hemoglobin